MSASAGPAPPGRCARRIPCSRRHSAWMPSGVSSSTRLDSAARKWRSCETNSMVPSYSRQRRDQHLLGRDVEMVGRLVEHQEVRRVEQHLGHHQPRLLAARQHAALLLDLVAGKAEAAGQRPQRRLAGLRESVLQRLEHRAVAVEQVHGVLGEIAHLDAAARAPPCRRRARSRRPPASAASICRRR